VKKSKAGLLVNNINSLSKVLMNNSFYQAIPLEKPYLKTKKKASHKCGRVMGNLIFKPNS